MSISIVVTGAPGCSYTEHYVFVRTVVRADRLTIAAVCLIFCRDGAPLGWRRTELCQPECETSAVVFYQRLMALLERRGIERNRDLTPLEFATGLGLQPALQITRAYNRVRFGGQELSAVELREIERTLNELEGSTTQ